MDVRSRNHLLTNRQALQRDIKTAYIMDHLISDEVLTPQEEERVRQQVELPLAALYLPGSSLCPGVWLRRGHSWLLLGFGRSLRVGLARRFVAVLEG